MNSNDMRNAFAIEIQTAHPDSRRARSLTPAVVVQGDWDVFSRGTRAMTAWISMISDEEAGPELRDVLTLARTPHGTVDNVMRVHSHRPSTMRGHVVLYRAALHDPANTLPTWLQEVISSWVSILNDCPYSLANHWTNAAHLIGDADRAEEIRAALDQRRPQDVFDGRELALMEYTEKLTLRPGQMCQSDVQALRDAGLDDGEILEANQIIGYFNYVNRLLNGLGVTTDGDVVGYYKKD
ncbi:carboxymuconolactone decarboxylase family protein [Roseovarius pelagicus]|uniref:Peroxidase-related enzyme n=1 Tax=Roseovarius pelagicus TaxID=2980108 RepID=A0ABY6DJ48_9RHOB|nr:peroxidase-related enzyme [Roseovarius pelagicus]UXX83810.1 peroxidase-related enzyme [Roseovarius pelagicus]